MALYYRDTSGNTKGQVIDVAIYEAVFAMLESTFTAYDLLDIVRKRTGSLLPGIAPSNIYRTKDGKWLVIAANTDNTFCRLAQSMGNLGLTNDPRFASHGARWENVKALDSLISEWAAQLTSRDAIRRLSEDGVPVGQVYSIADIVEDPHYSAREMFITVADEQLGELRMPGIVPKLSETPGRVGWAGPRLGEHNNEVYGNLLSLTNAELVRLKKHEVI
jgi:crotonobetainyl-CoA:carnitine CoA-transferase CaiB-like acyl-CoA transferase